MQMYIIECMLLILDGLDGLKMGRMPEPVGTDIR